MAKKNNIPPTIRNFLLDGTQIESVTQIKMPPEIEEKFCRLIAEIITSGSQINKGA
jgi:hypothetical protein